MRTLIQHADLVLPTGIIRADLLIENGRILGIDPPRNSMADEIVDGTGLHLLPGVIDDQVHFRDPGLTHKEDLHTGSLACAKGGVTTFLEMPNTKPTTTSVEALHAKLDLAASKSVVNYGFYIGATETNVPELASAHRTPGIKIFIGSSTGDLLVDSQSALERIFAETKLPICAHCEDEATIAANKERLGTLTDVRQHSQLRDHRAAFVSTQRAIGLAHRHNHRFHVLHVSTADEVSLLTDHRGLITAEACPHHLLFHVDDYDRLGNLIQMNPSIKTAADNIALWQALRKGAIQVIATDHAPHTLEEKDKPYPQSPSGLPAVENSLALMLDSMNRGLCTLEQIVAWMCDAPARVWDIVNKGRIAEGYDADLVLVDLNLKQTIHNTDQLTKCGWSPWNGVELTGWPVRTWVMGQTVFRNGRVDSEHRGHEAQYDHTLEGFWGSQLPIEP